jgi:hypothetical protein
VPSISPPQSYESFDLILASLRSWVQCALVDWIIAMDGCETSLLTELKAASRYGPNIERTLQVDDATGSLGTMADGDGDGIDFEPMNDDQKRRAEIALHWHRERLRRHAERDDGTPMPTIPFTDIAWSEHYGIFAPEAQVRRFFSNFVKKMRKLDRELVC